MDGERKRKAKEYGEWWSGNLLVLLREARSAAGLIHDKMTANAVTFSNPSVTMPALQALVTTCG